MKSDVDSFWGTRSISDIRGGNAAVVMFSKNTWLRVQYCFYTTDPKEKTDEQSDTSDCSTRLNCVCGDHYSVRYDLKPRCLEVLTFMSRQECAWAWDRSGDHICSQNWILAPGFQSHQLQEDSFAREMCICFRHFALQVVHICIQKDRTASDQI